TTRLLKYSSSQDAAKLTRYGKSYLRMLKSTDTWLFENRQVAKIGDALSGNLFEHVIPLCEESVIVLREMISSIIQAQEVPSHNEIIRHFLDYRAHYTEMISQCLVEVRRGYELLKTEAVQDNFSKWLDRCSAQDQNDFAELTRGDLRASIDSVHRVVERLHRKWADFLNDVMDHKRKRFGVVDFRAAALYVAKQEYNSAPLNSMLLAAGPPLLQLNVFSSDTFMGALPSPEDPPVEAEVFGWGRADDAEMEKVSALKAWINEREPALLSKLQAGPRSLKDLVAGHSIEMACDVFSLCSLKSVVEDGPLCIGITDDDAIFGMDDGQVSIAELLVWIDPEYEEDDHDAR
ncbi:hypothetical protein, partial [Thalassospira xiamenensis]